MTHEELKKAMREIGDDFTKRMKEDPDNNSILVSGVRDGSTFTMVMGNPMSLICAMSANMKDDENFDKLMKGFAEFLDNKEMILGPDA